MERRAYVRQPLELDAWVAIEGGSPQPCQIRDFSLGGVFLALTGGALAGSVGSAPTPAEQQDAEIGFSAELNGTEQEFRLGGRVVRFFQGGMGIQFVDPDPRTLLFMQELANQAHKTLLERRAMEAAREAASSSAAPAKPEGYAEVNAALRELTGEFLKEQVEALFKDARDGLFVAARDAPSNVKQNQCFDAIKEIENIQQIVEQDFRESVLGHLKQLGTAQQVGPDAQQIDGAELTLVDSQKFQDWLTVKHILERAEPKYKESQYELMARLSVIAGTKIDEFNNPIGPLGICGGFYDSLQDLGASRVARQAIFDALEGTVVARLGKLHDDVNEMFVSKGILPTVERPKPTVMRRPKPKPATASGLAPKPEPASQEPVSPPAEAHDARQGGWGGASQTSSQAAPPPATATEGPYHAPPAGSPAGAADPVDGSGVPRRDATDGVDVAPAHPGSGQPSVGGPPMAVPSSPQAPGQPGSGVAPGAGGGGPGHPLQGAGAGTEGAAGAVAPSGSAASGQVGSAHAQPTPVPGYGAAALPNAFNAVRSLLDLQRQAGLVGGRPSTGSPGAPSGQTASVSEVSGPHFDREEIMRVLSTLQEGSAEDGIETHLHRNLKERVRSALQASQPEGMSKQVGEAESDAIELTANLVESVVEDVLISDEIKSQLRKLEIPLLKTALQDEGFFASPSHPARRVVDQLGRLNVPTGDAGAQLKQKVEQVVDEIASGGDGGSAFASAIRQLDGVVQEQVVAYEKNVQSVVEACDKQESVLQSMRKDSGGDHAAARARQKAEETMPAEWRQWLDRARRLRVGDMLAVNKGGKSQRETLAWISGDKDRYVFVDPTGNRASSMIQQELAMQLRRGLVKVLEEAALPAMERGLHKVMREMHEKLAEQATRDPLTGLLNRKAFVERLDRAMTHAIQTHSGHVLCHLDLDRFSEINEKWGKTAGDRLLERFGFVLTKNMGEKGFTARLGEDEFGLVMEQCTQQKGYENADRLRRAVANARCYWKGESLPLSVSIGLVSITEHSESVSDLLEAAESACTEAKHAGRDRVEVFKPAVQEDKAASVTTDWSREVSQVLESNRLQLRCQRVEPIGDDGDAKPHYEILLGVKAADGKLVPPTDFIHAAERSSQMTRVDRWVIRTALQWMADNKRRLLQLGGCAINLSGLSLSDKDLVKYVLDQFTETKVPPGKVVFEVTETAAIDRLSNAEDFIRVMKEYGCRFSLDDFGTGHSSYSYLKQLPVDYVKIDGMFVKEMHTNASDYAMVKSINEIGHVMGKKTIAEYVENDEILRKLRQVGVDYAQGYGVEKPILLDELG